MKTQINNMSLIAILAATWFSLTIEAVPLTLQDQLNVALQKIAELKGNASDSCCNVSHINVMVVSQASTHGVNVAASIQII